MTVWQEHPGSMDIYLDARALEAADHWELPDALHETRERLAADLRSGYRLRDKIDARLAELGRGPVGMPKPRYRTNKQQSVAQCARCGAKDET